jgi:hypothetical protein
MGQDKRGQGLVFWVLVAMGFVGFAPCVLLPEWRQREFLSLAEQKEAYRLEQMEQLVARERASYEALRDDPAVLARLAQRDLSFRRLDHLSVPVPGGDSVAWVGPVDGPTDGIVHEASGSGLVESIMARLPRYDYDAVFCDDHTRSIVMTMSVGLIALAFFLFPTSGRIRE